MHCLLIEIVNQSCFLVVFLVFGLKVSANNLNRRFECWTKGIFAIACLGKNFVFHTETFEFREQRILKTGFLSSAKGVVQSESNLCPRLPVICRLYYQNYSWPKVHTKKVCFSNVNIHFFAY